MYFSGVNRGVSFTKAGFYTTGFVVLLGFIATGSGYNSLFLALGYGLSVLTISGILSERIMKHLHCVTLSPARADAGTPFPVTLRLRNESRDWHLFGIECLALTGVPRFRLMPAKLAAPIEGRELIIPPGREVEMTAHCRGLPRGVYDRFHVVQRTLYPFGLLIKYKVSRLDTRIVVLPRFDEELARALADELSRRAHGGTFDQEFHSHRPLTPHDSLKRVDWRKSAGLEPGDWAVRIYESSVWETAVLVEVDWSVLVRAPDVVEYEGFLSTVRTACEVIHKSGRQVWLGTAGGGVIAGHEAALEALAEAPDFASRETLPSRLIGAVLPGPSPMMRLRIARGKVRWYDDTSGAA